MFPSHRSGPRLHASASARQCARSSAVGVSASSFGVRVPHAAIWKHSVRSFGVSVRPSSTSRFAISSSPTAFSSWRRADHCSMSACGTPTTSATPFSSTGVHATPRRVPQLGAECRLVQHPSGLLRLEQLTPVEREPLGVCRVDLVR